MRAWSVHRLSRGLQGQTAFRLAHDTARQHVSTKPGQVPDEVRSAEAIGLTEARHQLA